MRTIFKKYQWNHFPVLKLFLMLLLANLAASVICQTLISFILYVVVKPAGVGVFNLQSAIFYILNINIMMWLWSIIYFVIHYFENFKQSELKRTKVALALKDSELEMLKRQLDPHFTFNALNNIRMLVLEDAGKAREAITNLSDLLRYSLQGGKQNLVPLEQELEISQNYLELQKIQFEERLNIDIRVEQNVSKIQVPPFCIQLLAENAVKHGISQQVKGGSISLDIHTKNNQLIIQVSNTGNLNSKADGTKTGLKNLEQRLKMLYKTAEGPTLLQKNDNIVLAEIKLPLNNESSNN